MVAGIFRPGWRQKALSGSEMHSGGIKKSVANCKRRWTEVWTLYFHWYSWLDNSQIEECYFQIKHLLDTSGFDWDDNISSVKASADAWNGVLEVRFASKQL